MSKKPKPLEDMFIDEYYEQGSEREDDPNITINNSNEIYEFQSFISNKDIKEGVKRIRKHAEWLNKAADYVEKRLLK